MPVVCERFDTLGTDNPNRSYRLGIMGGTFDPIHIGHLACAEQARVAHNLDAVIFIPAGNPVFKRGKQITPADMRLEMCRLATLANPYFDISAIEIERGGDTYTVDTLRQLREHYPENVELYFITGADAMLSILKWRESGAIAQLAKLIAVTRPGYEMTEEARAEIAAYADFDVSYLETTALSVSSSMLREWVGANKSIRYLTPLPVFDYIQAKGLYRSAQQSEATRD